MQKNIDFKYYLFICFFLAKAAENQGSYIIQLPNINTVVDAKNALHALQNPFNKEQKKEYLKAWLTGNAVLDKGMFQLLIYKKFNDPEQQLVPKSTLYDYFLYRISKYAYQTLITIAENIKNSDDVEIPKGWKKLYEDLQWFCEEENRQYLSPMATFNYGFLYTCLNQLPEHLSIDSINIFNIATKYVCMNAGNGTTHKELLDYPTKILNLFNGLTQNDPCNITSTINYAKYKNQCMAPIFTKDSIIGLTPLIQAMMKKYCIVGIGFQHITCIHNNPSIFPTGKIVHDILHFNLQSLDPLLNDSYDTNTFMPILKNIVKEYQEHKTFKEQRDLLKCIFSLFMLTHELSSYEQSDNISLILEQYLTIPKDPNLDLEKPIDGGILFNFTDTYKLYQLTYPKLTLLLKKYNLDYDNQGKLMSLEKTYITNKQIIPVMNALVYCIFDAWNTLLDKYENDIQCEPFQVDNPKILAHKLGVNAFEVLF